MRKLRNARNSNVKCHNTYRWKISFLENLTISSKMENEINFFWRNSAKKNYSKIGVIYVTRIAVEVLLYLYCVWFIRINQDKKTPLSSYLLYKAKRIRFYKIQTAST